MDAPYPTMRHPKRLIARAHCDMSRQSLGENHKRTFQALLRSQEKEGRSLVLRYRWTRPDPPPFSNCCTSCTLKRLKSPGMEGFRQLAATANLSASWGPSSACRP